MPASPPRPRHFPDLQSYVAHLERIGQLVRVHAEVDPYLEVSEITQQVIRRGGPALLFTNPKGADFPLVTNLYGSQQRIELAIGRDPAEIGRELVNLVEQVNPPTPAKVWALRSQIARARFMRPRTVHSAPVQEVEGHNRNQVRKGRPRVREQWTCMPTAPTSLV